MFRPGSAGLRDSAEAEAAAWGSTCDRGPIMFVNREVRGGNSRAEYSLFTPVRGIVEGLEFG